MEGHRYQNPGSNIYVCSNCRTPIVMLRYCTHVHIKSRTIHTAYPENLVISAPEKYRRLEHCTLADVRCTGCYSHLGWRCIEVHGRSHLYQGGKFAFYLRCLLLWDGNRMRYAHNMRPVARRIRRICRL